MAHCAAALSGEQSPLHPPAGQFTSNSMLGRQRVGLCNRIMAQVVVVSGLPELQLPLRDNGLRFPIKSPVYAGNNPPCWLMKTGRTG